MNSFSRNLSQGVSALEVMVALAAMIILMAFAVPTLESKAARSSLDEATDQVAQAFLSARMTAQLSSSTVSMTLDPKENVICFSSGQETCCGVASTGHCAENTLVLEGAQPLDFIALPAGINISGDTLSFSYSAVGTISTTGAIALSSAAAPNQTSFVEIDTLMGRPKVNYSQVH